MTEHTKPPGMPFQNIHDEFRPRILRYLRRLVGESDAEDLAQEVFVKVAGALPGFRAESSLATWVYKIATNSALDHLRRPSSRTAALQMDISAADDPVSGAEDVESGDKMLLTDSLLIRKDMNDCIRGIVDNLPELYRTVLVLSDLEGLTNAEIAGVLGITLDAVKIRRHRARTRLRKELQNKCAFYRDGRDELACDRKPLQPGDRLT
jgi:RNA polymerase sigma-70 factor (ECF subfamily)